MPRSLAIETSGRVGSVALVEGQKLLAEEQFPHGLRHAAEMLTLIDRLCRQIGWKPRDIQQIFVSSGPGSFTGLRIGITCAKTLAFALNIPVVATPTLRILAENAPAEAQHVAIVLDAKRGQIFTGRFERVDGIWQPREPAHLDSLAAVIARAPRPLYLLGEGMPLHADAVPTDGSVIVTGPDTWRARAAVVAAVGDAMARAGQFTEAMQLVPVYVRIPEAEEKRLAAEQAAATSEKQSR
jgi:tRNA threonylcarbamoyladenosine biosynthesis protein TsaB